MANKKSHNSHTELNDLVIGSYLLVKKFLIIQTYVDPQSSTNKP